MGKGVILSYRNLTTQKTYTVNTAGSVDRFIHNPDGTYTLEATGHNGYVYLPGDATGPRVIEYTGRLVVTVDATNTQTLSFAGSTGTSVDVCAALS